MTGSAGLYAAMLLYLLDNGSETETKKKLGNPMVAPNTKDVLR